MKKKRRLLALLLAVCVTVQLIPSSAFAVEGKVRDTNFFTPQYHGDVDFEDMEYQPFDLEDFQEKADSLCLLAKDAANADVVRQGVEELASLLEKGHDMERLANIQFDQNVMDEGASLRKQEMSSVLNKAEDCFYLCLKEILQSPCASSLDSLLTEEKQAQLLAYNAMTEELRTLMEKESALVNEYLTVRNEESEAEYEGKVWTYASAASAYADGTLTRQEYEKITIAISKEENRRFGAVFMELLPIRRQIATLKGYDSYGDYAYEEVYSRDYMPQELGAFREAVKKYIVPLYKTVYRQYASYAAQVSSAHYDLEEVIQDLLPCLGQMSDELQEPLQYMIKHGMYDVEPSEVKAYTDYTAIFQNLNEPFYFTCGTGELFDVVVLIHEFGHYNNFYWHDNGWNAPGFCMDTAEVHSQGFQILFYPYAEALLGEDAAPLTLQNHIYLLNNMVEGCLHDELQQYIYSAGEDLTLEQINQEYARLCREYGKIPEDDPRTELYGWVNVVHTFQTPFYYISYAVSAAGAYSFWLESQDDYFAALDDYLRFSALDNSLTFQEALKEIGVESPLTEAYVKDLATALTAAFAASEDDGSDSGEKDSDSAKGESAGKDSQTTVPLTGDDSEMILWLLLLLVSSSVIVYIRKDRE